MSTAFPFGSDRSTSGRVGQSFRTLAIRLIETVGFWAAVLLPLAYPALLYGGLDGSDPTLLLAAIVLNAVALVTGHDHNRDRA